MLDDLIQRFRRRDRNALARLLSLLANGERVDDVLHGVGKAAKPARSCRRAAVESARVR